MEQINDLKMKICENVDETQNENMEVISDVVNEIENENMVVVEVSKDEEELPDAFNGDNDDDSSSDDSDISDLDDGLNDYDDLPSHQRNLYKILSMADIQDCMRKDVLNISEILSVSKAEAVVLLLHCCWNVEIVTESWFANSEEFREELGLFKIPADGLESPSTKDMTCGKCSQTIPEIRKFDAFCSHKFCNTCWKDFIGTCPEDPRLMLECPDESCNAAVNQEMIITMASEAGQNLYPGIFLRSYLDYNIKGKWCPTPGCYHAVFPESANSVSKFTCKCLFTFCYKCLKEAHAPLSCATAERWRKEQLHQSRNRRLVCTRKCLKCEWPVEVKAWFKHMECPACHFHFCRGCSSSWLEHGHWEGDHHIHICPEAKLKAMNDLRMKNVISENVDVVTHYVVDNENEIMVVEVSKDEEELPDAFNGSDDDSDSSSSDDYGTSDVDDGLSDSDDLPSHQRNLYKILSMADVQYCMQKDVLNLSEILPTSKTEAVVLLLHCCWNVEIVTEKWFANSKEFREELGLFQMPTTGLGSPSTKDMTCGKCSQKIPVDPKFEAFCSHKFCNTCWKDFIGTCLKDPRLLLECPDESCNAPVNQEMIITLALEAGQNLYPAIFLRLYLDDNCKGKWCPTPGCNHAVFPESNKSVSKFTCKCLFTFCYKCLKEAHTPLSCVTAQTWRIEQLHQSQNWQLACVRECPKCEWPVEVKARCEHLECPACCFHFCRGCHSSWLEHGHWDGDYFTHICLQAKLKAIAEDEKKRAKATNEYSRFQESICQWNFQDMDQNQVLMKLRAMQNEELKAVAEKQALPLEELSFVSDAWLQAAECKRVFKYTFVYNFYFLIFQENRKPLYNALLKNGAFVLEQLCLVAAELRMFVRNTAPAQQFEEFRKRLCLKTSVARNYFQNMEIAIHNEYTDIKTLRLVICLRESIERKTDSTEELKQWACPHCSFFNDGSTNDCVMCYH